MANTQNTLNNNSLTALVQRAAPHVINAIKKASAATGVSFAYMLEKASTESGFNAAAKSASSSATGLYQFIDKTWLSLVKKYGPAVGLGKYAAQIDDNGHVSDPAVKQQILALRKDPDKAAMMAAKYTSENKNYMQSQLGPDAKIGSTELGLAHFLGAGQATAFLKAYQQNPLQQASDIAPKAANANRGIFYDSKTGAPRTVAGVYDLFAKKFGGDVSAAAGTVAVADASSTTSTSTGGDTRKALAQTLMSDIDSTKNALSSDSDTNSSDTAAPTGPVTYLADNEIIHWNSARPLAYTAVPPAAASRAAIAATTIPSGSSLDSQTYMNLLSHHQFADNTASARSRARDNYARLNS